MILLGDGTVADYRRDGAVPLRGVLTADEVEDLRAGVERNLAEPGPLALVQGDQRTFFEDFRNWERIAEFERVIRGSRLAQAAGELMGAYCIDGMQNVSFWIPLDPVSRENTLEFAAGSHAAGTWYMPRTFVSKTAMVFDEGALEEVPDIDADRDAHDIVGWPLEPGDALAFHMLTLHQAAGSRTRRRAFSLRLLGDDIRYAPRPHRTSPPFPELDGRLEAGAPMPDDVFPLLWRRAAVPVG